VTEFVLTATRFDQVLERDEHGRVTKLARRRRGDTFEVDDADVTRLLAAGAIRPAEDAPTVTETPPADQSDASADPTDISAGPKGPIPPKTGVKELWVDYAVSNGWDRDEAESKTRAELIAALAP
jgi:hypothetical protein